MKRRIGAAVLLVLLGVSTAKSYAGDMGDASGVAAAGTLSLVAAPLLIVGGTAVGASEATAGIVKLVGETGDSLADLTLDALQGVANDTTVTEITCPKPCSVNVTVNNAKKDIPLVVRKDYVQLNQKID